MKRPFFYRKQVRFLSYSILAFVLAFWLTLLVNLFLFLLILLKYREYRIYKRRCDYGGAYAYGSRL